MKAKHFHSIQKTKYKTQETAKKLVSMTLPRIVLKHVQVTAESITSQESISVSKAVFPIRTAPLLDT